MADQGTSQWRGVVEAGFSRVSPTGTAPNSGAEASLGLTSTGPNRSLFGSTVLERVRQILVSTRTPIAYSESVGDSISLTEALSLLHSFGVGVTDTASASDSLTTLQQGSVEASDSAGLFETTVAEFDAFVAISEGVPLTENTSLIQGLGLSLADSASVSEVVTALKGIGIDLTDSMTLIDAVGIQLARSFAAGDTVAVTEALSFITQQSVSVADSVSASDAVAYSVGTPVQVGDTIAASDSVFVQSVGVSPIDDTHLLLTFPFSIQPTNTADPIYFEFIPLDGGVPVRIDAITPNVVLGTVTSIALEVSKPTNGKEYLLHVRGLVSTLDVPLSFQTRFVAASSLPRVDSVEFYPETGSIKVTFKETMRGDAALTDPREYSFTGPTSVSVLSVQAVDERSVLLKTLGFAAGSYQLTVNATGTPKDLAGNPTDPSFNTVIFTGAVPETQRSVFVDRGPIAKPPLTIQTGVGVTINDPTTLTLTGGSLGPTVVGLYLTLGGTAINGGVFQITTWVSPTKLKFKANFHTPDASLAAATWEVFDPRNGEIADDPADVVVRINGTPVVPEAVVGLQGQILLASTPDPADDVEVDYSFICNPTVEVRRLNSKEFRFNAWNRDQGYLHDASGHHYRYNNVLISPSNYTAADMQATLPQPLQRDLKYRAYERAYSALFNDPNLLLFNSPLHRIAYPPMQRTIESSFVNYQPTTLPESYPAAPWERNGVGSASLVANRLVVGDTTGGPFPSGNPIFWTRQIDLTFPCVYAATWQMQIDAVTTPEGIWTGIAAGFSNDRKAIVVGYLEVAGVKKFGVLKRGFGNDPSTVEAWTGGLLNDSSTGLPADLDWSILHSFRVFQSNGVVRVYIDGEIIEALRLVEDELPFLEELNDPFNQAQNSFFGSLSRPAINQSTWDFVRYLILPTNPFQTTPSVFVSYEGNDLPEYASSPWTPVGYHGVERVVGNYALQVDSTSATDMASGFIGGDFRGFVRLEPLLAVSSDVILDVGVQILNHTHGITPNAVMAAIDDGSRLLQLSFLADKASPKASYGGKSLPEDFQPTPWTPTGTASAAMFGRTLRITDTSTTAGRLYYWDDNEPLASSSRIFAASTDYTLEFRCTVQSHTPDMGGFSGVSADVYDGSRVLGLLLLDLAGVRYVAPHSDGTLLPGPVQWPFEWDDAEPHTYRLVKSGSTVNVLVDGALLGTLVYADFTGVVGPTTGTVAFGSSTAASMGALSTVDWEYTNIWRDVPNLRHYVGFWKGTDPNDLTGYHLPLKASNRGAVVIGNTLQDTAINFVTAGVVVGDQLIIDVGGNKGTYEIASVSATMLTITTPVVWPVQPSLVSYRIPAQVDWTQAHKYRLVRAVDGAVTLLLDAITTPLVTIGYNEMDLPLSTVGVPRVISGGIASITWGALDPTNLSSTLWDFVRYGITRSPTEMRIAPHHQNMNQRNVIASPEHLRTNMSHAHTDYWSSDTGIPPQTSPDFLQNPLLVAYTLLNEDTPLVPSTQSTDVQVPVPTTQFASAFNRPEDLFNNDGDFTFNDGAVKHVLFVPDDVLYTSLEVITQTTGEAGLLTPFCDTNPDLGHLDWTDEVCLTYDGAVLPENSDTSTPWTLASDIPANVTATPFSGVLTYGTTGATRTVYRNPTPLPDSLSLATEVKIRMRVLQDASFGLGDSQVRLGFSSSAGFTLSLAFVTTPLGERYVLLVDQNTHDVLGGIPFDWYDGQFHTYKLTRDPAVASVLVSIDT